ncbi:MAG TPA: TRAP transporter large permease [Burkholderiales bacterium]
MEHALLVGLGGLAVLIVLIVIRMPIAHAMIIVGFGGISILSGPQIILYQLKDLAFGKFANYDLSVLPMFLLMGYVASHVGLSRDLFRAARAWFGWMRGGVAMAAMVACAGFGAVCGSSLATASTMGQIALPELRRYNYSPALATGALAAGGTLGILIPPSIVLVVYAIIVEANIATLFMAAFIPGFLATLLFIITIAIYVMVRPEAGPKGAKADAAELRHATVAVLPVVIIFLIVIGGIYAGVFNPTPAAAVGVFLVGVYGALKRKLTWRGLIESLVETAKTTGMIYLILLGAELLNIFMSRGGVPQAAAEAAVASGLSPYTILILLLIALIILGCLMDSLSLILLVVPFFWPVIAALDFGMSMEAAKLWFGIICLIVVELGLITPPVGLNVFVINSMAKDVPMIETFKGVMPFFFSEVVRVSLILAFPSIVLFLPNLLAR